MHQRIRCSKTGALMRHTQPIDLRLSSLNAENASCTPSPHAPLIWRDSLAPFLMRGGRFDSPFKVCVANSQA